jgi:putative hydrolase of the HAD superfamily
MSLDGIRVIGLDLMGTLLYDPYREALLAATGRQPEELVALRTPGVWETFELGRIDEETYAERFFTRESGVRFDVATFRHHMALGYRFLPGMKKLLEELAALRPVHILSNYPVWYEDLRQRFELDLYVSGHQVSYVLGARKPAREFYERSLAAIGCEASELLFVDDRADNVSAADTLGMRAIVFDSADALRTQLSL